MAFPPQPSGSLILVSWPCLKGYFPIIPAIQAYLCHRFRLTVDFLGQLERDVPAMADNVGANLGPFLAQRGSPPSAAFTSPLGQKRSSCAIAIYVRYWG